MLVTN